MEVSPFFACEVPKLEIVHLLFVKKSQWQWLQIELSSRMVNFSLEVLWVSSWLHEVVRNIHF